MLAPVRSMAERSEPSVVPARTVRSISMLRQLFGSMLR